MDCIRNKTVGWAIGNRNAKTFKILYEKLKDVVQVFYTDDWKVYNKIIPSKKLVQGKKHTVAIDQSNSNIRHNLVRMTRKTKVESKSIENERYIVENKLLLERIWILQNISK